MLQAHYTEYFKCSQFFKIYLFFENTRVQYILTILTPTSYSSQTHLLSPSLLPNFVSSFSTHLRSPDLYGSLSIHIYIMCTDNNNNFLESIYVYKLYFNDSLNKIQMIGP